MKKETSCFPFKRVLFMSNFTIDMGDPKFREGAYLKYLAPLANVLKSENDVEVKYLIGSHTLQILKQNPHNEHINNENSFVIDYKSNLNVFGLSDEFIKKSYNEQFSNHEKDFFREYFLGLFCGWVPDLIVCWEFPTNLFRELFPETIVIDLMPGLFMRPPYPRTISLDAKGLYKDSCYNQLEGISATDKEKDVYKDLRMFFKNFYNELSVKEQILSLVPRAKKYSKFILVPLQITGYFGFYENCRYKDQFDFLLDVLTHAPKDTGVIVTQYCSGFISEKAINEKNIEFFRSNFPNFLYSTSFEKIDNISQFIVPWVDSVCSISSTIGLQAKFFGKELISPSRSHLSFISEKTELDFTKVENNSLQNENLMALLINRQIFLEERLLNERGFFSAVLEDIFHRYHYTEGNNLVLPASSVIESVAKNLLEYKTLANFETALKQLNMLGGRTEQAVINNNNLINVIKNIKKRMKKVDIVSFDVFDTLVYRTVWKPEDVFLLIQKSLSEKKEIWKLPQYLVENFAILRSGMERQIRKERDLQLENEEEGVIEEITIEEVYDALLKRMHIEHVNASKLIELEESIELSVLRTRTIGKYLLDVAKKYDKKVIVVSDFIHGFSFVKKVLESVGIKNYDKLYVSSQAGVKKHSGNLFEYVIEDLSIDSDKVLHIGDNAHGDYKMALEKGMNAIRITSAKERGNEILIEQKLSPTIINKSFYLRTVYALFSEKFLPQYIYDQENVLSKKNEKRALFQTGRELGFLALGPVMFEYAKWIIETAKRKKNNSIIFFARDGYVPYQIVNMILKSNCEDKDISVHYIATSRIGLKGLNLYTPEDFFLVRIDDYSRNKAIAELIKDRFDIDPTDISCEILNKWGIEGTELLVKHTTPAAIYGIVYEYVLQNWESINRKLEYRRAVYKKYLEDQNVDLRKNTLAIDFGYKGSTHRMIKGFFEGEFTPAFFMTYGDEYGNDPIEKAESYYFRNLNSIYKAPTVYLNHNLIIETIMNEPTGTLVGIEFNQNTNCIEVIKEEMNSPEHIEKVNEIHQGIIEFVHHWLDVPELLRDKIGVEGNVLEYFLTNYLRKPSYEETQILRGMIFDNSFSGHKPKFILSPNNNSQEADNVWKEGFNTLIAHKSPGKAASKPAASKPPVKTNSKRDITPSRKNGSQEKNEFILVWGGRQFYKLVTSPSVFFAHLNRWREIREQKTIKK